MSPSTRRCLALVALLFVFCVPLMAASRLEAGPVTPSADDRERLPVSLGPATIWPGALERPPAARDEADGPSTQFITWQQMTYYAPYQGEWDVWLTALDMRADSRLTGDGDEVEPDLNRGATQVVYAGTDDEGDFDIFVIDVAGGAPRQLTDNTADDVAPSWAADGRIAFTSYRDGNPEIYVMTGNGLNETRLTHNPDFDGDPDWSPDGAQLAFSSRRNGQYRIWTMKTDGTQLTQRSFEPGSFYPAWSPDGKRITYSADSNGDGWLDLRLLTIGDARTQSVRQAPPTWDLWAGSWTPDGERVSGTQIIYELHNGRYYITDTRLFQIDPSGSGGDSLGSHQSYPFEPSWASADIAAPLSTVSPLPAQSPSPLVIRWSVQDVGIAGIGSIEIQTSVDDGPWTTAFETAGELQTELHAWAGQRVAIRSRATDEAGNIEPWPPTADAVTTIEALPPVSHLSALPPYARTNEYFQLEATGGDPGGSVISSYLFETRIDGGTWTPHQGPSEQPTTAINSAALGASAGQRVDVRVRAIDTAGNIEPWPADPGDTGALFYDWALRGKVTDNTGVPVSSVVTTSTGTPVDLPPSDVDGRYGVYMVNDGDYAIAWAKPGYGALPLSSFSHGADATLNVVLPPADNLVANGDFEAAALAPSWNASGPLAASLTAASHTGRQALALAGASGGFLAPMPVTSQSSGSDTLTLFGSGERLTLLWSGYGSGLVAVSRQGDEPWSVPEQLVEGAVHFSAVTDALGRVHVVAEQSNQPWVYLLQDEGGGWSAPEDVPGTRDGSDVWAMSLADGRPAVVWTAERPLMFTERLTGGGWSTPQALTTADAINTAHGVLGLRDGSVMAVVNSRGPFDDYVGGIVRRLPNGTVEPMVALTDMPILDALGPLQGPDGRVHVLIAPDGDRKILYASSDGPGWADWQLSEMGFQSYERTLMSADVGPDGTLHVVLQDLATNMRVMALRRKADGSWLPAERLDVPHPGWGTAGLIVDGTGMAHLAYRDWTPAAPDIYYASRPANGKWSAMRNLTQDGDRESAQQIALSEAGPHIAYVREPLDEPARWKVYEVAPAPPGTGPASVSQSLAIPPGMANPTLSLTYRHSSATPGSSTLRATLSAGAQTLALDLPPGNAPAHAWLDVSPLAGKAAELTLELLVAPGGAPATAVIDDVSLGSGHADLWVSGYAPSAAPGASSAHQLQVGNRSPFRSAAATLTYKLPPELLFVSADPPPASLSPLTWSLGPVGPNAKRTFRVVVAVKPSARPSATVLSTATVTSTGELETLNNTLAAPMRLARDLFLPALLRP